MQRASFSLGRQTPARRSTLIPSTLLQGASKGRSLALVFIFPCFIQFVFWLGTTFHAPILPSAQFGPRAFAITCSMG
jgi:hypothetical protein